MGGSGGGGCDAAVPSAHFFAARQVGAAARVISPNRHPAPVYGARGRPGRSACDPVSGCIICGAQVVGGT